ncbi:MAG: hypothetical protein CTY38_01020 [Methylotenera sp.]|uniref:hypothetical protein n=1 Tax=Methylotenera sp. TaxID=2051956 RepID=UPI000D457AAB|nr:hypothetical protein [Methylotenera sp.]PPC84660.1 MAG: hypothetical protein CTY38_01020 [Methylotenera sp.]
MSFNYKVSLVKLGAMLSLPFSKKLSSNIKSNANNIADHLSTVKPEELAKSHMTALMLLVVAYQNTGEFAKALGIAEAAFQHKHFVPPDQKTSLLAICHAGAFSGVVSAYDEGADKVRTLSISEALIEHAIDGILLAGGSNKRYAAALGTLAFLHFTKSHLMGTDGLQLKMARDLVIQAESNIPGHHQSELTRYWPEGAAKLVGGDWENFVTETITDAFGGLAVKAKSPRI